MPSEFRSLEDLHAIIKFNNYPPMRTRFGYKKYESIHAPVVLKDSMYLTHGPSASANNAIEDIEISFEFEDEDQGDDPQSVEE
jgi:hypothetical protein